MSGRSEPPAAFQPFDGAPASPFDPLRLCIYTTIAILAWVLTPAVVVAAFAGFALVAYFRARRSGLVKSRCKLGDTRLVMAYLGLALVVALGFIVRDIVGLI